MRPIATPRPGVRFPLSLCGPDAPVSLRKADHPHLWDCAAPPTAGRDAGSVRRQVSRRRSALARSLPDCPPYREFASSGVPLDSMEVNRGEPGGGAEGTGLTRKCIMT